MKNNSTKIGTEILKHGDFTLKHFNYCDIYFLFYKGRAIWDFEFNGLFSIELRDCVFEKEPDSKKATLFLNELYNWGFSQLEAFGKILDEIYGEKI